MNSRRKAPAWLKQEFPEANLRSIRSELKTLQTWANGYTAAGGKIPGTSLLGGPNRAIVLIDRLLDAYK